MEETGGIYDNVYDWMKQVGFVHVKVFSAVSRSTSSLIRSIGIEHPSFCEEEFYHHPDHDIFIELDRDGWHLQHWHKNEKGKIWLDEESRYNLATKPYCVEIIKQLMELF